MQHRVMTQDPKGTRNVMTGKSITGVLTPMLSDLETATVPGGVGISAFAHGLS